MSPLASCSLFRRYCTLRSSAPFLLSPRALCSTPAFWTHTDFSATFLPHTSEETSSRNAGRVVRLLGSPGFFKRSSAIGRQNVHGLRHCCATRTNRVEESDPEDCMDWVDQPRCAEQGMQLQSTVLSASRDHVLSDTATSCTPQSQTAARVILSSGDHPSVGNNLVILLKNHPFSHLLRNPQWQAVAIQWGIAAAMVGLQACTPSALAEIVGPEVARVDQSAGFLGDLGDIQSGFASAFLLIFFSEIGDKTFFIAALLATRKSNAAVFTGTFGALVAMSVISVTLGRAFHYLDGALPFSLGNSEVPLDDLAAVVLLVYFGVSTLLEAGSMEGSKAEGEQQEAELAIAGVGGDGAGLQAAASTIVATFVLVFVAEWGDKSFFSTIALAAASSPLGVVAGAIAGHGVATALAVLGGAFLGTYISEKVIAYVGGVLFLVFAAATLVQIVS